MPNKISLNKSKNESLIHGPRRKVLIVDDESALRKIYDIILRYDFEVDEASNALMALEKIILDIPCCVLLDIRMPGRMSGLDLCRHIKDNVNFRQIKVVIITGSSQEFDRSMANDFGADGYFEKPVSPNELVKFLRNILV